MNGYEWLKFLSQCLENIRGSQTRERHSLRLSTSAPDATAAAHIFGGRGSSKYLIGRYHRMNGYERVLGRRKDHHFRALQRKG